MTIDRELINRINDALFEKLATVSAGGKAAGMCAFYPIMMVP